MSATKFSDRIVDKLHKIVKNKEELNLIIDLLEREKHYTSEEKPQNIKKEFQLLIDQHFPLGDSQNE